MMSDRKKDKAEDNQLDWKEIEKRLSKVTDPQRIQELRTNWRNARLAAACEKIEKLAKDGLLTERWPEIEQELEALPPPTAEELELGRKLAKEKIDEQSILQILHATGEHEDLPRETHRVFATVALYYLLASGEGLSLALSRAATGILNATMDCLTRANNSELPVRGIELNLAFKGAVVFAMLSKAQQAIQNSRKRQK
jgi:hypothetical protein